MVDGPPQLSKDAFNTTTPNLAHLMAEQCTYTCGRWTPQSIKHRCLEYHYTKLGRSIYIEQCIYTHGRLIPLAIKHRCLEYCYTTLGTSHGRSIYIEQCTYTHGRWTLHQLSIDALNTLHQTWQIYIYRTMHIYPWQINPPCNQA